MKVLLFAAALLPGLAKAQWHPDALPALRNTYYNGLYADKCVDGNCKEGGTGTMRFKSYAEMQDYTGTFGKRGSFVEGKLTFHNGDSFEGRFSSDLYHDKELNLHYDSGTYHKAGAYTYTARFVNDRPDGPIVIHFDDGGEYSGTLRNGYYEGRGRIVYSNGLIYDGDWAAGKRVGNGSFTDKTKPGYWFAGQFADDYPNGFGKLLLPGSPDTIAGQFASGHRNGIFSVKKPGSVKPSYTYFRSDTAIYTGMTALPDELYCLNGNCQSGQGKLMDKDGNRFEGTVKAGRLEGPGSTIFTDGSRFAGTYAAGKPVQGKATYANGNGYEGHYAEGSFDGQGIYRWADGSTYTGNWEKGAMKGRGVYVWGDGSRKGNRYEGEFIEGRITGQGVLHVADGSVYAGRFNGGDFADGTYTLSDGTVYESNAWGGKGFASGTRRRNGVTETGKYTGTEFINAQQAQAMDYADKHPWLQGIIPVAKRQSDMQNNLVQRTGRIEHLVREVNLANGSYSIIADWDMLASFNGGFKRYYILAGSASKKYPVPFGIRITYEFVDSSGMLISRQETTSENGFEGALDAPTDGKYRIQAKFDYKGCIGCREEEGTRLKFTLLSFDYVYPDK